MEDIEYTEIFNVLSNRFLFLFLRNIAGRERLAYLASKLKVGILAFFQFNGLSRFSGFAQFLRLDEIVVRPPLSYQLLMGSAFQNLAITHDVDCISILDCRETMSDGNRSASWEGDE